ncbi:MAG: dTDP-4-amino-4,6-dideoxygalactose transaminase, partial [Candidatus Staskawiczbacteria bacterium]|nr:dTDP-4-amino-4,6-dideoxygalactose transaminase [Candidatus Staskawiczbacteria bacterium]
MIPFNKPLVSGDELKNIKQVLKDHKFSGDGNFTTYCQNWLETNLSCPKVLLTTSGSSALDMAAILAEIKVGDEVIMPSFTFVSTANAFVLRGAKIIFVDIRPDTMNIDEKLIERAISQKTKAIVVVHYAGIACEMTEIMKIARRHKLLVIEDAAQAIGSKYKNKSLGTIGDIGCISFHETKNITCGEGGALILNRKNLIERAEIIREKGTNRSKFFRGEVDKYSWVDIGSSFLPSEINAAFLLAQLESSSKIINSRRRVWNRYFRLLAPAQRQGFLELPLIPKNCMQNGHIFYLKTKNLSERTALISHLKKNHITAVFHYVPLHSSIAGKKYGIFKGKDKFTTLESEKLLRLPLFYGLKMQQVEAVVAAVNKFYAKKS